MKIAIDSLKKEEQISLQLEKIYDSYGYRKFKMSSFEEYSMYHNNSDFLLSENVITFSSKSGKLLALRPDVTLSIIKNTKATKENTEKLYYSEKVYRQAEFGGDFKEIDQTGVELIGSVDTYSYYEITSLALKSLATIGENYVLDVSNMSVVSAFLNAVTENLDERETVSELLRSKNTDDFKKLAIEKGYDSNIVKGFNALCMAHGTIKESKQYFDDLRFNASLSEAVTTFIELLDVLQSQENGDKININFSITGNASYYNGLIFNGFVYGIPKAVLSGGRYDRLLEKFEKNAAAIGFAVYLGEIERYLENQTVTTDVLVIYDKDVDTAKLARQIGALSQQGLTVRVDSTIPQNFAYKKLMKFDGEALKEV